MPSSSAVTAIFDIGKTNKKFLLFDQNYSIVHKRQISLEETEDDDGFVCEDLQRLTRWMKEEFTEAVSSQNYEINGLNFSTYGATLVHVGEHDQPVTPLYNYLKPFPVDLASQFYNIYGGKTTFSLETASPPMGMLNSGLQLYWLKYRKPDLFSKIKSTLHLPQYLSFLFTQKKSAELTSLGCHTGMWHFRKNEYHPWLKEENLQKLLPSVQPIQDTYSCELEAHSIRTGIGIHDSSAALVPYLMALEKPFIQLSTGTWSIAMNSFTTRSLTYEELERDCLHYINIHGNPVKASRFLLGAEYSQQVKQMGEYFGKDPIHLEMEPDPKLIQKLALNEGPEKKLVLEKAHQTGPYPHAKLGKWQLNLFKSYKEAVHQCMLDLVSIQTDAMQIADSDPPAEQVIITGGFAKNRFFCRLLATMNTDKKIYTASTPYASALGAALVLQPSSFTRDEVKSMLGLKLHKPFPDIQIGHYSWAKSTHQTDSIK